MKYQVEIISLKQNTFVHLFFQALPYRKQALIVSTWPRTSLPRDIVSVKRFQNLQALVNTITSYIVYRSMFFLKHSCFSVSQV